MGFLWVFMGLMAMECPQNVRGIAMEMSHGSAIGGPIVLPWDWHCRDTELLTLTLNQGSVSLWRVMVMPWDYDDIDTCHVTGMSLRCHYPAIVMTLPWAFIAVAWYYHDTAAVPW